MILKAVQENSPIIYSKAVIPQIYPVKSEEWSNKAKNPMLIVLVIE